MWCSSHFVGCLISVFNHHLAPRKELVGLGGGRALTSLYIINPIFVLDQTIDQTNSRLSFELNMYRFPLILKFGSGQKKNNSSLNVVGCFMVPFSTSFIAGPFHFLTLTVIFVDHETCCLKFLGCPLSFLWAAMPLATTHT